MICPECGSETSNEQAFCKQCGAYVRSQFGKVLSTGPLVPVRAAETGPLVRQVAEEALAKLEWAEIEKLIIAEDNLWPAETVFAIKTDDDPVATDEPTPEFDDALADDDFEQSLSGRIKREDLIAEDSKEDGPAEGADPIEPAHPSVHQTFKPEALPTPPPMQSTVPADAFLKTNPDMFAGVEIPQSIVRPKRGRKVLAGAGAALALIAVSVSAGIAIGLRFADYAKYETPADNVVPAVSTEPARPLPPAGMAFVPGGSFLVGSDHGDTISKPAHYETVEPFFMDTTEVTNRQYAEFVKATGQVPPQSWKEGVYPESEANFPVTGITWYEAAEYAAWKGKRLPTEAEWEFAARGTDGRAYPWGDEWDASLANAGEKAKGLRAVGQGGVSPFGIYDMAGNAWEWTSSDARSYPAGKEFPRSRLRLKIIRGGSWQSDERLATTYFRGFYGAAGEREYNGTSFRCVKDLPR